MTSRNSSVDDSPSPADASYRDEEIEIAIRCKPQFDRHWTPAVGHYVYDQSGLVDRPSPFQTGVYFVLNEAYFMTLVGGPDVFKRSMIWLPTWEQTRRLATCFGIDDADVARCCVRDILSQSEERLALYRLIQSTILHF